MEVNNDNLIRTVCHQFANHFNIDIATDSKSLDEAIEEMLTRLEEYSGLVDLIRSDSSACLGQTLPVMAEKTKQLEKTFQRIDQLEAFVALIKHQMAELEVLLAKAESEAITANNPIRRLLSWTSPFFGGQTQRSSSVPAAGASAATATTANVSSQSEPSRRPSSYVQVFETNRIIVRESATQSTTGSSSATSAGAAGDAAANL